MHGPMNLKYVVSELNCTPTGVQNTEAY